MPVSENAGRANTPTARENTSHMDDLKELLEARLSDQRDIMDERDRRYEDRFKAMDEKTSLALTSSEKAVSKAETATEKRFDAVNEFRSTLADQATNLLSKAEANAKFQGIESTIGEMKHDIASLRESRSAGGGERHAQDAGVSQKRFDISTLLAICGGLGTLTWILIAAATYFRR